MKATKTIGMMNTSIAFSSDDNLSVELAVACNTYAKSDNTNCILDVTHGTETTNDRFSFGV
jgi:hypothetical protein